VTLHEGADEFGGARAVFHTEERGVLSTQDYHRRLSRSMSRHRT
jgi:hypothetical protein